MNEMFVLKKRSLLLEHIKFSADFALLLSQDFSKAEAAGSVKEVI
jgi:hypothetical protein